jgi:hypothetical protein
MSKSLIKSKSYSFIQDLQLAYADVLEKIFNCYTHDDDGACNHEATAQKTVYTMNDVTVIYQPIGDELWWVENSCVLIMPTKESGITLTKAMFNKAKPLFRIVEEKLIDSVNGFISKYGGWIEPIVEDSTKSSTTFEKITGIFESIHFDEKSGKIKMKWELKTLYDTLSRWWNPVELMNWKYSLPAHQKYYHFKIAKIISTIADVMDENTKNLNKNKTRIMTLKDSTQDYKDTLDTINTINENIEYQENEIKRLRTIISNSHSIQERYIENDDQYIKDWYKRTDHKRESLITYEEAFGIPAKITGKKRNSSEIASSNVINNKKSKN